MRNELANQSLLIGKFKKEGVPARKISGGDGIPDVIIRFKDTFYLIEVKTYSEFQPNQFKYLECKDTFACLIRNNQYIFYVYTEGEDIFANKSFKLIANDIKGFISYLKEL